jgi:hypothetical protein
MKRAGLMLDRQFKKLKSALDIKSGQFVLPRIVYQVKIFAGAEAARGERFGVDMAVWDDLSEDQAAMPQSSLDGQTGLCGPPMCASNAGKSGRCRLQ